MTAPATTGLQPPAGPGGPECRAPGVDPEWFFPIVKSTEQLAAAVETAHLFCKPCPARAECRRLGRAQPAGIWGGRLHVDDGHRTRIDLLDPDLPTGPRKARRP